VFSRRREEKKRRKERKENTKRNHFSQDITNYPSSELRT
jgi:hypothetical protein